MSHILNNKALGLFIYFSEKEELETNTGELRKLSNFPMFVVVVNTCQVSKAISGQTCKMQKL